MRLNNGVPDTYYPWYKAYRKRGETPKTALHLARIHATAQGNAVSCIASLSVSSQARIETFVDEFIRGPEVEGLTSDRDSDFINESERASRCYDAAENGADGKTHADVIQDWRDAFSNWLSDNRRGSDSLEPDRFSDAVEARFTLTELWHEYNGSLFQEIG